MIKTILTSERVPVKIWAAESQVEEEAKKQLLNTASLPFVYKWVAAMPDVHLGVGATVGSVICTKGAISPAAVGVDIGCGMMAVKTPLDHKIVQDQIAKIRHSIERSIPVGFEQNRKLTESVEKWVGWNRTKEPDKISHVEKAFHQMGSLGGGNHFIEICLDTENAVWVMLHSGSRGIGNILARKHIDIAKNLMEKYHITLADPDLAYFAEKTQEFNDYFEDLEWAQAYASENRQEMMRRVLKDLAFAVNNGEPFTIQSSVNCHHNYVARENHFGQNVLVTRKGAVRARTGDYGIIPGSMGTKSYIVRGLGSNESFHSCSHGAGRRMSRTKARATFTKLDLEKQTEGVDCRKDEGVLDEIPGAYKDIDEVMENQKDLVEVVATLKQIMCVKG